MTPLPKRRISRRRQGKRRAAIKLTLGSTTKCPNCGKTIRLHTACIYCGQYKGRVVINKTDKPNKKK